MGQAPAHVTNEQEEETPGLTHNLGYFAIPQAWFYKGFSIRIETRIIQHARNTLEHNCARLAVAHLGRLKRRTASAISAT